MALYTGVSGRVSGRPAQFGVLTNASCISRIAVEFQKFCEGVAVKYLLSSCLIVLLCSPVNPQARNNWPHPPEAADDSATAAKPTAPHLKTRTDPFELQREAKELLELSQSLQPDMESVNHGILPKDTTEKLKRIEKLSKRLRGELGK